MPAFRKRLLAIQRSIYQKSLRAVNETLKVTSSDRRYAAAYYRGLRTFRRVSSKAELVRHVLASDLVFHGDYHPLKQSQRSVFRILRDVVHKRPIVLCLEMFHAAHQHHIDAFMAGAIDESIFLDKIDYQRLWGFPWSSWKSVIDLCREHHIPILGLNATFRGPSALERRDALAAQVIAKALLAHPGAIIYAVAGDYHVCPRHLPAAAQRLLGGLGIAPKRTIIYQNGESLYWKLAAENLEETDVVQVSDDSFCIMNSTPTVKVQSYLNWIEQSSDAWYPSHTDWEEPTPDATSIPELVKTICSILGLHLPDDALGRLEVFYSHDLDFMSMLNRTPRFRSAVRAVERRIHNGEGFLLEYDLDGKTNYLVYLATVGLNMAAEEASHFVNAVLRGRGGDELAPFDRFYRSVITEALGFFGSKLINERRKTSSPQELRRFLGRTKGRPLTAVDRKRADVAHMMLRHLSLENKTGKAKEYLAAFRDIYRPTREISVVVSTQLGYLLGNLLFYGVKRGIVSVDEVRKLFHAPLDAPLEAFNEYMALRKKVKSVNPAQQSTVS